MSDWNKILWALFIISVCTLNSIIIKKIESEKVLKVIYCIGVVILWIIDICWVFFDFWK